MNTNIFNSSINLDCFCADIAEAWIKYQCSKNWEVSSEEFMDWVVNELEASLEYNFDTVYEEEFGHREEEDD